MIRVLIVEDDPLIAEAHRQYAQRLPGFVVHATVGTGSAAVRTVAAAAADGAPIELVLLDIGLEDNMDGWQVLHRLRSQAATRDIPVVVLSARDERE